MEKAFYFHTEWDFNAAFLRAVIFQFEIISTFRDADRTKLI